MIANFCSFIQWTKHIE